MLLHLDCFSGIAGNMFLGALIDLGLSRRVLAADLQGLDLPHRLVVRGVRRAALAARYVEVRAVGARAAGGSRKHREIVRVLRGARLDADVRARALAIYEALAEAEARVHGVPVDKVHFHEVGAVDAIVDVTGAAIGLSRLGIGRVSASPVALGGGRVESDHGTLPLPAPATLELLRGIPTVPAHVEWETVTPTGAAILRCLVDDYGPLPAMTPQAVGYGAGNERPGPMPNVLRAVLGHASHLGADRVLTLETHLDDLVPEHFDYLMERLFEAGALDVSLQHLQMKKNRPGFLVRVIARPAQRMQLAGLLLAESTALGVRVTESDRVLLPREVRRIQTPFGRVAVKFAVDPEGRVIASPEYEACKRAARKHGVPLREVVRAAEAAARE
ncbi:MAG: nickel pincer cofactor biosynthesis protein LarC [Myxococcota bacterium]